MGATFEMAVPRFLNVIEEEADKQKNMPLSLA